MEKERVQKVQLIHGHLKEVLSLQNLLNKEKEKVQEQQKRAEFLQTQRTSKLDELESKKQELDLKKKELNAKEKELFEADKKLENIDSQLKQVTDNQTLQNLESNKYSLDETKEQLEEYILNSIDKNESLESEIAELEEFEVNSEKTISELNQEIESLKEVATREIKNYRKRMNEIIQLMKSEGLGDFSPKFTNFKDKGMTCFYRQGKCEMCGMSKTGVDLLNLREEKELVSCLGCKRYLIFTS